MNDLTQLLRASIELETLRKANKQLIEACEKAAPLLRKEGESLAQAAMYAKDRHFSLAQEQADKYTEAAMLCECAAKGAKPERCADCDACARHAYSDATTPGFFYTKCSAHRAIEIDEPIRLVQR